MKKFLCILLACVLLLSSTAVFATNGNGNGNDKKFNNYNDEYENAINALQAILNNYSRDDRNYDYYDQQYIQEIINQILKLKQKYKDGSTSIFINGREYSVNDGDTIKYKNFVLPVKPVQEGLGANVNWNSKTHIVTITDGNITLIMNLDNNKIKVNGFDIKNSVLTSNKKNQTIVLIKFIAEVLGKNAEINEGAGAIIIDDDGSTSINDNTKGNGLGQFNYSGKWNYGTQANAYLEDNHWSSSRNAYYKVKFEGTQIKLYGATSNNHGIAAVSIDNGRETNVDFYSSKRADNVLVYTSPVLKPGQHTLKVRVTGTKNSKSKGTNVTADRATIFSTDAAQSNIALNKSAFSDSQQSENPAYKGNDGNTSTRWSASDSSINHWWTVDLGALYNINGSQVTWEKPNKAYKYKIEVSPDNYNWTLKVNKTNSYSKQQVQSDSFSANSARYVRITVTGLESGCWASFSEFKVFGSEGTNTNVDTKAPTAPTSLKITAPVPSEVALNWNASYDNVGIAGYKIYRNGYEVADISKGTSYRDRGLAAGTTYVYSIVAYDAAGNYSNHSEFAYVTTPNSNGGDSWYGNGNGLKAEYYNNKDLTDLKFTRTDDTVDNYWKNSSPDSRIDKETFSIRWSGQIQPLYSETYTFYTTSDDGVRLWVNGVKLIDNWCDHSETENNGNINLTAGQKYDIKLEYYNNCDIGKINLKWSSSSQSKQIVPKSQLYSSGTTSGTDTQAPTVPERLRASAVSANQITLTWNASSDNTGVAGYRIYRNGVLAGTVNNTTTFTDTGLAANTTYTYQVAAFDAEGNSSNKSSSAAATTRTSTPQVPLGTGNGLKGEYYDNIDFTNLIKERVDENINFNWWKNAPIPSMGADEFSVRWTGQIQPLYSETYTFTTVSDDGARLWINGTRIIDDWREHSSAESSGTITLTAGQKYDIKYEYFDKTNEAEAKLFWSSPSQTKQIVPKSQLYCTDVDTQAPSTPDTLRASAVSSSQVVLNWRTSTDNTGVAGYRIYRNGSLIQTVTSGTTYTDTGLAANTSYTYTVSAYDAAGNNSPQSLPVTISTQQPSIDNLALGRSAVSDSEENGNSAQNGNDGNLDTRWCAADGNVNHWWQVDLGSNLDLTGTEITWEKNKVYKYRIEVSADGTNWTAAVDNTGNNTAVQTKKDSFNISNIKYVKVTVTGLEDGCWASFSEFKVF